MIACCPSSYSRPHVAYPHRHRHRCLYTPLTLSPLLSSNDDLVCFAICRKPFVSYCLVLFSFYGCFSMTVPSCCSYVSGLVDCHHAYPDVCVCQALATGIHRPGWGIHPLLFFALFKCALSRASP